MTDSVEVEARSLCLEDLPDGVLLLIFRSLCANDAAAACCVSTRWHGILRLDLVWRPLAARGLFAAAFARAPPASPGLMHGWYGLRVGAERRWERAVPRQVLTCDRHTGTVFGVDKHPLSHHLFLSGGEDGVLRCWDSRTGVAVSELDLGGGGAS